ncbi:nucleoside diphosphate-linked moiety x motif 6 [Stylonychia lemnae]|uniref:Nucleoside diphosphate-linked moiety x motif 6 n=1 Tax=Stylonychia lemnae TaxID=5949 RepID=A0A078AYP5_STYLE|nr:nucleoside diphosphate-linked moiety x motif 6 [Stylonychia lemnae]|eukprot:CDW85883.1 nucleoside diphosphate-linked moiety x motif 6 [Stylonychia lemnae]
MTKWMPQEDNKLPGFSTHYVGVGGLVISKDKSKILAIQESKPLIKDLWKLPGGLVERGENLQTACIREVFEETGVQAKFKDLRHLKFTRMATNVCNILLKSKEAEEKKEGQSGLVNLKQVPLGDLFKTTAFTPEEYELFGTQNIFYSSEYMKLVGESIKNQNDSAKL